MTRISTRFFEVHRRIGAEHPSLPGHFPDAPIVPGVVILDEVFAALAEWRDGSQVDAVRGVKFLVPLKPEQLFAVRLSVNTKAGDEVDFCCRVGDRVIVEGRLQLHGSAG